MASPAGSRRLFHLIDDLLDAQLRAVEDDGVLRRFHRCQIARLIAGIARLLGRKDVVEADLLAARFHFALTTTGTFERIGLQKEFTGRVRKDDSALIAALADH